MMSCVLYRFKGLLRHDGLIFTVLPPYATLMGTEGKVEDVMNNTATSSSKEFHIPKGGKIYNKP